MVSEFKTCQSGRHFQPVLRNINPNTLDRKNTDRGIKMPRIEDSYICSYSNNSKNTVSGSAMEKHDSPPKKVESLKDFISRQRALKKQSRKHEDASQHNTRQDLSVMVPPRTETNENQIQELRHDKESIRDFVRRQRKTLNKNKYEKEMKKNQGLVRNNKDSDKFDNSSHHASKTVTFQIDNEPTLKGHENLRHYLIKSRGDSPITMISPSTIKTTNLKSPPLRIATPPGTDDKKCNSFEKTSMSSVRNRKQVSPMDKLMNAAKASRESLRKKRNDLDVQNTSNGKSRLLYATPQEINDKNRNFKKGQLFINLEDDFSAETPPERSMKPSNSPSYFVPEYTFQTKRNSESFNFSTFSSTKRSHNEATSIQIPVLSLGNLYESLHIDFADKNIVGDVSSRPFNIHAPFIDDEPAAYHSIEFERIPFRKGFNLVMEKIEQKECSEDVPPKSSMMYIRSGETRKLSLTWTPIEAGPVRETIYLKLKRGRICIVAHGSASLLKGMNENTNSNKSLITRTEKFNRNKIVERKKNNDREKNSSHLSLLRKSRERNSLGNLNLNNKTVTSNLSSLSATRVVNTSTAKHTFRKQQIRPPPEVDERRTSGRLTHHVQQDDGWAEKQCHSFCKWLNFNFNSAEDLEMEVAYVKSQEGGTNHTALRTLQYHQRKAQGKIKAANLFNCPEFVGMRKTIESEIQANRLSIRTDRDVLADVALRGQIVKILLSYSSSWLRLGLETIFAETITIDKYTKEQEQRIKIRSHLGILSPDRNEKKPPSLKMILKRFILDRVITDPRAKKKYTGNKCNVPSGNFEKRFKNDVRQNALRRIFLLVIFLDHAKVNDILEKGPCLFTRNGIVKSSRDVLVHLCRDYMGGEGDIVKHLMHLGVSVSYEQTFIDEFDFSVNNLAVDLRDGVRLGKLVEILTGDAHMSLLGKMRLPAVSRLQKLFNMKIILGAFTEMDFDNIEDIHSNHIVDGHRAQLLKLLWAIISHFRLPTLLNINQIINEINAVYKSNRIRVLPEHFKSKVTVCNWTPELDENNNDIPSLLLHWCRAVCSCFGLPIDNFTNSFSDGKAICLLIHYYHPAILPLKEILPTSSNFLSRDNCADEQGNNGLYEHPFLTCTSLEEALENERKNSSLANRRMADIGGIPNMLPVSDSNNIPEEKSTIICVAYLCSRLIESSKEILASITIQTYYKEYLSRKLTIRKGQASQIIIKYWRENKKNYFEARRRKYIASVRTLEFFSLEQEEG